MTHRATVHTATRSLHPFWPRKTHSKQAEHVGFRMHMQALTGLLEVNWIGCMLGMWAWRTCIMQLHAHCVPPVSNNDCCGACRPCRRAVSTRCSMLNSKGWPCCGSSTEYKLAAGSKSCAGGLHTPAATQGWHIQGTSSQALITRQTHRRWNRTHGAAE